MKPSFSLNFANPLDYPLAMLVGGVLLVVGVRGVGWPSGVMLPVAGVSAIAVAGVRRSQEPETLDLGDAALEAQVYGVLDQARALRQQAEVLRQEAGDRLVEAHQMDLLVAVQLACDRAQDLPEQIQVMARQFQGQDALVSVRTLEQQLSQAQVQLRQSQGLAREQLQKLTQSLQRNIALAQQGQDVRQAQVISLSTLILQTTEVLQRLQIQLRRSDLHPHPEGHPTTDSPNPLAAEIDDLIALSEALAGCQKNLDVLMSSGDLR